MDKKKTSENDIEELKKLLILQMRWEGVPAELIGKIIGKNKKTINNLYPVEKYKKSSK